jgi:hypothetical protein
MKVKATLCGSTVVFIGKVTNESLPQARLYPSKPIAYREDEYINFPIFYLDLTS